MTSETKTGSAALKPNPYEPVPAGLVEVIQETPTIKTFVLEPPEPMSFRAGQFVQLTLPGVGEAPFTPSSSPYRPERIEVTVLKTGKVTDRLHQAPVGTTLGLRGPFGKGYPIEKLADKEVLIVGGGVGLAPLRSLILALLEKDRGTRRVSIKYGARVPEELLYRKSFEDWRSRPNVDVTETVDREAPGWAGRVGLVTTLLEEPEVDIANCYAFSCGPEIMLRFVTLKLLEKGFEPEQIYLSMNRKMSCGIGTCGRCNIGPIYLCKDGPDVCYADVKDYPNLF